MTTTVDMPIALTGGVVYLLMALTMARMLGSIPQARVVRLWVLGAACCGVALLLAAARSVLPRFLGFETVGLLGMAAAVLQTIALRELIGMPRPPRAVGVGLVAALVAACVLWAIDQLRLLFSLVTLTMGIAYGVLAWHAWLTARRERSGSASLLAWSQGVLMLALIIRSLSVAAGVAPFQHGRGHITFVLLHATLVLAALYGSLGFMGLMLDITRRAEARAREGQVAEAARREAAEQTAQDLRGLLQQRDALSAERERMLQLLAHEIRQPLHNASGALRAAGQALRLPPADGAPLDQAAQRLGRAEAVLGDVRAVLDNTLAAATLLSRSTPVAVQEVELAFMIELALGDLDEQQRRRVTTVWQTDQREVEIEPSLVRLALRNLLVNAFGHGGPQVQVQLQVAEQVQPPALLLRVVDDGPGLPPEADRAAPVARRPGLGLVIVRQVAALHGGRLTLAPAAPHGLQAELLLPLPAA